MFRIRDRPDRGDLAKSSSKSASAGRTMLRGRVSHSCCLCKSNGSVMSRTTMAETLATLALISALAMFISPILRKESGWQALLQAYLHWLYSIPHLREFINQGAQD